MRKMHVSGRREREREGYTNRWVSSNDSKIITAVMQVIKYTLILLVVFDSFFISRFVVTSQIIQTMPFLNVNRNLKIGCKDKYKCLNLHFFFDSI